MSVSPTKSAITEKPCTKCKECKPLEAFAKAKTGLAGRLSVCRACHSLLYYQSDKGRIRELVRRNRLRPDVRERERAWQRQWRVKYRERRMLLEARTRATAKGLAFNITESDIVIPILCPVLGIPILPAKGNRSDNSPSLDRIDTSQGYTRGNVQVISWRANRLKNDATITELRQILAYCERNQRAKMAA